MAGILPRFLEERRDLFKKSALEDPEFQTFCHQCRHFEIDRLRCLLVLRERKVRIKLDDESPFSYCLYWNLDDRHPVLQLTERLGETAIRSRCTADGMRHTEKENKEEA